MDTEELQKRINQANEQMLPDVQDAPTEEEQAGIEYSGPFDLIQQQRNSLHEMAAPTYRGGRPRMTVDFSMIEETLPARFKKAKNDSDYYTAQGNKTNATLIRQQYMNDVFLPAVDALVRANSLEAVVANSDVLSKLDAYTLLDGTRGSGYTKTYLTKMYAPTGQIEASDGKVRHELNRIRLLVDQDENRMAASLAKQLKEAIDAGRNLASSEDYAIIEKVALSTS